MASTEFDKDFGYLMPFLDRVAAAARDLSDRASRAELIQLIADEKRRWARARELLSGSGSAANPGPTAETPSASDSSSNAPNRRALSFTVGSLRVKSD